MFWRKSKRTDADFTAEISAHLELEIERLKSEGMSQADAEASARRAFGNMRHVEEQFHESSHWMLLEHLRRDIPYALRTLSRNPSFTLVAVISLALGIGVNALVFSVVNAIILRPLPVEKPDELVFLENSRFNAGQSFPTYRQLRDHNQVFSGTLGYRVVQLELDSRSGAARTWGYLATGNYFDVLGVKALLGRVFHAEDDLHPGASPYAVLSYASWQSRFGGDRQIVGKTIRINRQPYTVIGVAPKDFHGTEVFYWPEVWVPMMMQSQIEPGNAWLEEPASFNTWVIGRLKPEIHVEQAVANLNTIAAELARINPAANEGLGFRLTRPGLIGDAFGSPARAFSFGVLALSGLVLLTACANLASLVTARTADRRREIAIRLSIGATRGRVARQLLTETLVLSALGGAGGYGLATLLSNILSAWRAPMDFPVQFDVSPDWRVFCFSAAVSVVAGMLFGLAPARHAARTDANSVLKRETNGLGERRLALRDVLVVVQVALCFVLVTACLLSLRGMQRSLTLHLGFQPEGVSVAAFDLGLAGYSEQRGKDFQRRALEALERLPGVISAAYSNSVPLSIDQSHSSIYPEDQPNLRASSAPVAINYEVSPHFFETMKIQMLAGRDFDWHDDFNAPRRAIINLAFAKQILHTDNAVGKRFQHGPGGALQEVIGVVEDGKYMSPTERETPVLFEAETQQYNTTTTMIVRSTLPESQLAEKMRQTMAQLDPELPLFGTGPLSRVLAFAFFPLYAAVVALSAFGVLAIVLAITGIHGLVSYGVARRIHEIGIRVAIGASPSDVIKLVLGKTFVLLGMGAVIGLVLALAAGRLLETVIYGSPRDPLVFVAVCLTMVVLGLISSWAPTRRALRIEPTVALRHE
jgi:macrolide transport system ATP-binding/permease protein